MKKFMARGSDAHIPDSLVYGPTYWMCFRGVAHEGFTFILRKQSKKVILCDNEGTRPVNKSWLKEMMKSDTLQFLVEIEPED